MREFLIVCLVLLAGCAQTRDLANAGASHSVFDVYEAERQFAIDAQIYGVRQAFLNALSEDALAPGPSGWVDARASYENEQDVDFSLTWWPAYVWSSTDKSLQIASGPAVAAGDGRDRRFMQYLSVWMREDTALKLLYDVGIVIKKSDRIAQHESFSKIAANGGSVDWGTACSGADTSLGESDEALNALLMDGSLTDLKIAAHYRSAVLMRDGIVSEMVGAISTDALKEMWPASAAFVRRGVTLPESGDLGVTVGEAEMPSEAQLSASEGRSASTYLRVWSKSSCGWRLALDLTSF